MRRQHRMHRWIAAMSLVMGAWLGGDPALAAKPAPNALPPPVTLLSPPFGANVGGTAVTFQWSGYLNTGYTFCLQVDLTAGFTNPAGVCGLTVASYTMSGFQDKGYTYYWRVSNISGAGNWSSVWYFVNGPSAVPATPTLVTPANGANVGGTNITFGWNETARATDYRLQVAYDAGFTQLGYNYLVANYMYWTGSYWAINVPDFPDDGSTHYWRVQAQNSRGTSLFSTVRQLTNGPSTTPRTPTLASPANGATVNGTNVTFGVYDTIGAADYWLQASYNSAFTQLGYNDYVGQYMTWNGSYWVFTIPNFPDDGSVIYWRVRGWNSRGFGSYSTARQFTNGPSAVPTVPSLAAPASGATVNGTSVTFGVYDTARAADYWLQASYNSAFTQLGYDGYVGQYMTWNGSYWVFTINDFPDDGSIIYWRVKGWNSRGFGSYSTARQFTNGPSAVPATPALASPTDGSVALGGTITFTWSAAARAAEYHLVVARDSGFSSLFFDQWVGDVLTWDVPGFLGDDQQYYWRVTARNSRGAGGDSLVWSFHNPVGACSPATGVGNGLLYGHSHIDTCYSAAAARYYLVDLSRRTGTTADHTHLGNMGSSSVIQTSRYAPATGAVTMSDPDDTWIDFTQASGVDAQVHTGWAYDYLNRGLGVNSFDRAGSSMRSLVEVVGDAPNAWWFDDIGQVWYTSQIGSVLPLSGALDAVGHVWGYAVTDRASSRPSVQVPWNPGIFTRGLLPGYESGALAVSFSDMLGTALEQSLGEVNWTIGEGILIFRDMQNPPGYGQPDTYNGPGYLAYNSGNCTPSDANDLCGVHTNSGVPNKMFYLLAAGGTQNGVTVQPVGTPSAMIVAMTANLAYWGNAATFQDARAGMESAATLMFNGDPNVLYQVRNAWTAVGVGTLPVITVSSAPPEGGTVTGVRGFMWGETATLRAEANAGYRFVKWTEGTTDLGTDPYYTFTVNGSRSLTANFAVYVPNIGVSPATDDFEHVLVGQTSAAHTFTVTNLGDADLVVGGVFFSGGDSSQFLKASDTCSGAVLMLNEACQIGVTFAPNAGGVKQTTLHIPSNDPDTPLAGASLTGTGDLPPTFTITASAEPGGDINPAGTFTVDGGSSMEFTITAYTGFRILDVLVDGSSVGPRATYPFDDIRADHTIKATFAVLSYTLTPSAGPGGSITPSTPVTVDYAGSQQFTFSAVSGATVKEVLVDGVSVGAPTSYTFTNVQADHSIQVNFGSALFVGRTGTGLGSILSDLPGIACPTDCSEKYPYGSVVTLTATPNPGSSFAGWSSACGGTDTCTVTMTALRVVSASFADVAPPVTTASPVGGTYASPQSVTLTCTDVGAGCSAIYYTTDGTTPTTASAVYSGPIAISTQTTLQYFARDVAGNLEPSNTQVYAFVVEVTLTELPNGDAGPNSGSPTPVGPHYLNVDDDPHDGDTSMIGFPGGGSKEAFTVADQLLDTDTVKSVTVKWVAKKGSGNGWLAEAGLVVDGQEYYGPIRTLPLDYTQYQETFASNPSTSQAWTVQDVRNLNLIYQQVQIVRQKPVARLTELVLVVTVERVTDVAAPVTTATPPGGSYASAQTVTLTCTDVGSGCSAIYYTTDGSAPTTGSSVYSAPIVISTPTTLQYYSRDVAGNSEAINTQVYDFVVEVTLVEPPNADAGPNNGSPTPVGPHYLNVDEDPHDGDTTMIGFPGGGYKEVFTVADRLLDTDTVKSVAVRWVAKKGSGSGWQAEAGLVFGGQEYYGPTRILQTNYTQYQEAFASNPATSQAWSVQDVRNLMLIYQQVQIVRQKPVARLTELVLVVTVDRVQ